MKILLPENISEITLEQYQRYEKLFKRKDLDTFQLNKRKVEIFTELSYHDLDNVSYKDFVDLVNIIDLALNKDSKFVNRFTMNDVEFGFIPNFDEITSGEFVDLSKYGTDVETLHNLMAILFRPITKTDMFDNYSIKNYNGTGKYKDVMKQAPMHIVNGALLFFCDLAKELSKSIQRYTVKELRKVEKHLTTSPNGDGTQLLND